MWHYVLVTTLVHDTHRLVSLLRGKGYSKEQAEGFAEALEMLNVDVFVEKNDIERLDNRLEQRFLQLENQLTATETRLTTRMATFLGVAVAILALLKFFA